MPSLNWLQRMADGEVIVGGAQIMTHPVNGLDYSRPLSCGQFKTRAKNNGWIARGEDKVWRITDEGRAALRDEIEA